MGELILRFFGHRGIEQVARVEAIRYYVEGRVPVALVIVALGIALGIAVLSFFPRRPTRLRTRVLIFVLRFSAFVLLFALLVRVGAEVVYAERVKPRVVIALDQSLSMKAKDTAEGTRTKSALKIVRALVDAFETRTSLGLYGFAGDARPIEASELEIYLSSPTDIASSLKTIAEGEEKLEAIFLVSDGVELGAVKPEELAESLRRRGTRVYAIGVGDPKTPPHFRVVSIKADRYIYRGDELVIRVMLEAEQISPGEREVALFEGEKVVDRQVVRVRETVSDAVFSFFPKKPGLHTYRIAVEEEEGWETLSEVTVDVVDKKIKVLYVEGLPRFEFKFLRQALADDPAVEYTSLLQLPHGGWYLQGTACLSSPKGGIPKAQSELFQFDVIILGNIKRRYFSADGDLEESKLRYLVEFVKLRGGGLVVLAGPDMYGAGGYVGSAFEEILPFKMSRADKHIKGRYVMDVTPEGLLHPIMRVAETPAKIRNAWEGMPELEGANEVSGVRLSAVVLGAHPAKKHQPLIAYQQIGAGKVLALAIDTTWRWQLTRYTKESYYRKFWANVVRYLAPEPSRKPNTVYLVSDRARYYVGDELHFVATPLDELCTPMVETPLTVTLTTPSGEKVIWYPERLQGGRHDFRYRLDEEGTYTIKAVAGEFKKELMVITSKPSYEFDPRGMDEDYLKIVAKETGGQFVRAEQIDRLFEGVSFERSEILRRRQYELRSSLPIVLLLIGVMCLEWAVRKKSGLV